jgi:hypothetical protein
MPPVARTIFDPEPALSPLIPKQPSGDCSGSGTAPVAGTTQGAPGSQTGECSVCGGRFGLGAQGKLERHEPASG